ncbi:MAG: protein kinase, partial [Candidatus Abyssubacteria bacterium]|nr:protein kinase [Candidatus Abyssubacteria bacterium]
PNIIQIFDITEEEGLHFFSMEYVEGRTLDDILKEKVRLDTHEAVRIISQAADGIEHAHRNDIIHRDIKSSNIILDVDGNVKVMDFGLAKLVGRTKLTGTGTIMGTVDYMSPEQASGEPVDHQSDIWSLGVVLYEMLTGETPFTAESDVALIHKIVYEEPPETRDLNPDVPPGLSIVLTRAMAKMKEDRYVSISEFLVDLRSFKTLKRETRPMPMVAMEEVTTTFIGERTPFVGRKSERAELQRFLLQAAQGQGSLVMIGGEPGAGKTRITEELVADARRHGFMTLTGHCYEMEGAPPYIPFVEILQSIIRAVEPDTLLDTLGSGAPEAAKLAPELRERFPDIPEPRKLGPEQERLYLFNNLRDFFERLARQRPLLLVFEDLHWADESTMLLIQHIVQQIRDMPILMVNTYRDTELDVARSLARALEELVRQRLAHDVILRRLPEADVSAMLRGHTGEEPPTRLVELIYRETEGNPFFVEEVYKHFAEEGKLFDAEGHWRSDLEIGEEEVPRGVRLVVGRRLERVSEKCKHVLITAAVIGRGFSFELLEELANLDEDALFNAIEVAEQAQLITSKIEGGKVRFIFSHELIRQTLVSSLSLPRRQRSHLRVAEVMERRYAGALEEHSADLAYHFYQAGGDPAKVINYSVMAAERATAQIAYEEAVEQYQRALQALEQQRPLDEFRRCDLLLALGQAYGNAGAPDQAKETLLRVTDIARKLPAPEQFAEAAMDICRFWQVSGFIERELLSLMNEGLALLREEDSVLRASLLGRLSGELELAEEEGGIALSEQALAMANRTGDSKALYYALWARAFVWDRPLADRISDATELAKMEEEVGSPEGGDKGLNLLCHLHCVQGDIAASDADLAVLKDRAAETAHPTTKRDIRFTEATRALMMGRFEEAERLALEVFALGQKVNEVQAAQYLGTIMYSLRWLQGRLDEADPYDAVRSLTRKYSELRDSSVYSAVRTHFYLMLGREEKAREVFEHLAVDDFAALPRHWGMPVVLRYLSEVAAALGDTRRAAQLYDLLFPLADRLILAGINGICSGAASHWLGLLAGMLKRWDDAVGHYEAALETNARIGARPFLAQTQHEYARMFIERNASGDKDKARTLLTEATSTYCELGMPTFLENTEELMKRL